MPQYVHYAVTLNILELQCAPYANGNYFYVKIKPSTGAHFETKRCEIRNSEVRWGERFRFECRMGINKTMDLAPYTTKISVKMVRDGRGKDDKVGFQELNIAEFAAKEKHDVRVLLDGRSNSFVHMGVDMEMLSGGPLFRPPKLSSFVSRSSADLSNVDISLPGSSGSARSSVVLPFDSASLPRPHKERVDASRPDAAGVVLDLMSQEEEKRKA